LSYEAYSKTIAHILEIIEKMQFLEEMPPEVENANFNNYSYYITGIYMDGNSFIVLSTVGRTDREIYYDHNVFEGTKNEVFEKAKNAADDDYKYSRLSKILKKKETVNDRSESRAQIHQPSLVETPDPSALKTGDDSRSVSINKYTKFSKEG
jgi:hypothetical protein